MSRVALKEWLDHPATKALSKAHNFNLEEIERNILDTNVMSMAPDELYKYGIECAVMRATIRSMCEFENVITQPSYELMEVEDE